MNNAFNPLLATIARAAERANALNPGDYQGEGGLWYCGKCRTPKQTVIPFGTVFCMCQCAAEEFNREQEQKARERRADNALSAAFDDPELRKCTFGNDDGLTPQYIEAARRYCDHFEEFRADGRGLLLWNAQSGSGKSWIAAAVVNELCSRGISCRMTSFGRILGDLKGTFNERDYIDRLMSFSLLVLDDLGAERSTPYAAGVVYDIINSRVNSGKPMIITTNLTIDEIKRPENESTMRIYSRILKCCHPIHVEGSDRRKIIAAKEYQPMKDILGI
ncbi:MAG: ATP-binding protein [Clostridia bacterium]|nr:ATP-binding protein [Clostridia bacterium]